MKRWWHYNTTNVITTTTVQYTYWSFHRAQSGRRHRTLDPYLSSWPFENNPASYMPMLLELKPGIDMSNTKILLSFCIEPVRQLRALWAESSDIFFDTSAVLSLSGISNIRCITLKLNEPSHYTGQLHHQILASTSRLRILLEFELDRLDWLDGLESIIFL